MTVRPQSQPASTTEGAWEAGLGPSNGHESSMRPRTAQPPMRLPIAPAQEPFQAPASRPQSVQAMRPKDSREPVAMFDAAVRAKTPPWVFKVSTDITNLMLKKEYEAMIVKQRQVKSISKPSRKLKILVKLNIVPATGSQFQPKNEQLQPRACSGAHEEGLAILSTLWVEGQRLGRPPHDTRGTSTPSSNANSSPGLRPADAYRTKAPENRARGQGRAHGTHCL